MASSGQRFIRQNRAPRVHIEYEVETYGSAQKVELPFVMGVMSDLSGKSEVAKKPIGEREFLEFDVDNFEDRMAAIAPRAAFNVDNTLSEDGGKLGVDLTFKRMADFSPAEVAKQIPALRKLLEARQELSDLMTYMDGKEGAQGMLEKLLNDPELMQTLAAAQAEADASEADAGDADAPKDDA